ncbi:unnamed protein product [Psylliodes chrysocephalus]|uniref:Zinc finger MYM-type protein 1-like n=1 Tax=Psylliodes chrysocephalus TaxID=3402493 RepID=A0A9P0G659_9CUCU|nr:unnamed protein product [Psylliodes chrysocephala]
MNKIGVLKNSFIGFSLEEKLQIKELGRPIPDLKIEKQSGNGKKSRCRKFNKTIYDKNNWLCGCEETNKLFCFVCVLFGGDETWSKKGTDDLVHIWDKMKSHEKSKVHMNNVFSFSMLGKLNIKTQLNSAYRDALIKHNQQVDKNRYVLNQIINCIRFCGAFELALRGHDEKDNSENRGIFRELVNFSAELDNDLKVHIQSSKAFKGTSKTTQNELLECMLDVYHEEVRKEIENSPFVAVIADETTDVACDFQLVIVLRYLCKGRPVERFWRFYVLEGHDAKSIAECILNVLHPLLKHSPNKLIAQSYDGASIMSVGLNGVQKIIKQTYPLANYVHCYAHQMNSVMTSACSVNKQARIFFSNLSGLCSFFSTSPHRTKILDEVVNRRLPRSSQTRWNFQSRGVHTVYENRKDLITVVDIIESTSCDSSSINQASGYKLKLQDTNFIFWLGIFHQIMPYVEIIFNQLQKVCTDSVKVKKDLENFEATIQGIREQMDSIIDNIQGEINMSQGKTDEPIIKKERIEGNSRKCEALEICDAVLLQIKTRFNFSGHLVASNLFMSEKFSVYRHQFPESFLNETCIQFSFLDKSMLKNELQVLYQRDELSNISGAVPLSILLNEVGLNCTFHETLKLLGILITIPMSTSEAERCFSMFKRIKTFLRNTMKEERLSALGMMSTEKHFLNGIENFNNKVIENFATKKERRMDFNYRKL